MRSFNGTEIRLCDRDAAKLLMHNSVLWTLLPSAGWICCCYNHKILRCYLSSAGSSFQNIKKGCEIMISGVPCQVVSKEISGVWKVHTHEDRNKSFKSVIG